MFWILLIILIVGFVFFLVGWIKSNSGVLGIIGEAMILVGFLGIMAFYSHYIYYCGTARIKVYEDQSLRYESGQYESYDELVTFKETIDDYNESLKKAQNKFYSWPYVSKEWEKCKKAEYPKDLHDKIVGALKKENTD